MLRRNTRTATAPLRLALLAGIATACVAAGAFAQSADPAHPPAPPPSPPAPEAATPAPATDGTAGQPELRAIPLEQGIKELRRLRLKHFGQIYNTEIRQLGIAKLREYNESKFYPYLLEIFAHEKHDVRGAILDMLLDQHDERADTTLAYAAVFDQEKWFRDEATKRLKTRAAEWKSDLEKARAADPSAAPGLQTPAAARPKADPVPAGMDSGMPWRVKAVIANGLKQKDDKIAGAAADLAADLRVFELIPALVNAQVQGPIGGAVGSGGAENSGALAYILIGTQQAFVSDLTPVVGDSAVAFDPTLAVATEGTVLRVIDAVVVTYRTEIHYALNRLANSGWDGRRTDSLGYDNKAWRDWYNNEFIPFRRDVASGDAVAPGAPEIDDPDAPK